MRKWYSEPQRLPRTVGLRQCQGRQSTWSWQTHRERWLQKCWWRWTAEDFCSSCMHNSRPCQFAQLIKLTRNQMHLQKGNAKPLCQFLSQSWMFVPTLLQGAAKQRSMFWKLRKNRTLKFVTICDANARGAVENVCMGAQLYYFRYAVVSKVDFKVYFYSSFGAHKLTAVVCFLAHLKRIWLFILVTLLNKLS